MFTTKVGKLYQYTPIWTSNDMFMTSNDMFMTCGGGGGGGGGGEDGGRECGRDVILP